MLKLNLMMNNHFIFEVSLLNLKPPKMKSVCTAFLLIFCTIFLACNNSSDNKKQKAANAKINIVSNNVRIDYTDTGKGDTTLLFVHGWCINKTYWADQVAHFGKRYRVVTIDLPGYGLSGKNRKVWNTAAFGQDISNVIKQLDLKNVVLIGHSMAGDIILEGAVNSPEKVTALVGVDNFQSVGIQPTGDTAKARKEYADAIKALKQNFKKVATDYFKQDLFYKTTSKAVKDRILNDVNHADPAIATACMEEYNYPEAAKLQEVKKKLYLINSDYHATDTTGLVEKKLPYKLLLIHATGHFPMVEKPAEFNKALENVMADINLNNR
jgi:pimeloyl-ACP methyl ester carboxylesterase